MPAKQRQSSGEIHTVDGENLQVFLSSGTLIKLTIPALIGTLGIVSGFLFFYHKTDVHMKNTDIHVRAESRVEAKAARGALAKDIKRHVDVGQRELRIGLEEHIKDQQAMILKEVKATRTEVRRRR